MATVTIDLKAAGLTHARGKSDRCDGEHDIDMLSVTALDSPDYTETAGLPAVFQALHARAHPRGTAYWDSCREPECLAAQELMDGGE